MSCVRQLSLKLLAATSPYLIAKDVGLLSAMCVSAWKAQNELPWLGGGRWLEGDIVFALLTAPFIRFKFVNWKEKKKISV